LDHLPLDGIDIVADLNKPLTLFPDNSVKNIFSHHVLEHIDNFIPLMGELHRIVDPSGVIEVVVPHFSNVYGFSDPTHVKFFGSYTMYYFTPEEFQPKIRKVPSFYTDFKFIVESVRIEFYRDTIFDKIIAFIFTPIVNRNTSSQLFFERRLSFLFHASQIIYKIIPIKK
jgi:ubiquinone/menaquinone biosynthesis C-methylase UbiE